MIKISKASLTRLTLCCGFTGLAIGHAFNHRWELAIPIGLVALGLLIHRMLTNG